MNEPTYVWIVEQIGDAVDVVRYVLVRRTAKGVTVLHYGQQPHIPSASDRAFCWSEDEVRVEVRRRLEAARDRCAERYAAALARLERTVSVRLAPHEKPPPIKLRDDQM